MLTALMLIVSAGIAEAEQAVRLDDGRILTLRDDGTYGVVARQAAPVEAQAYQPVVIEGLAREAAVGSRIQVGGWAAQYGQSDQLLLFGNRTISSSYVVVEVDSLNAADREAFGRACQGICRVQIFGAVLPQRPGEQPRIRAHALRVAG